MIAHALKLKLDSGTVTEFADDKDIPAWAKGAVAAAKRLGLVQGKCAGTFTPDRRNNQRRRRHGAAEAAVLFEEVSNENRHPVLSATDGGFSFGLVSDVSHIT
ncbi:S-layer homology domain-containing protein [Cohnella suwonensis]|uniref:S-layer homology domain-containing protein n=1 Tax=Cohnella suwonensis TaxID=696072 RepID=A0ABW0LTI4_9BACL